MRSAEVAADIVSSLRALADGERREKARTYYPTAMEVIGVPVPPLRAVVRSHALRLKTAPAPRVLSLVRALVKTGIHEARQVGYELLSRRRDVLAGLTLSHVEALGRGVDNWVSVDVFATHVAGPAWRLGGVPDRAVRAWARSKDRWWRRTALVCTVALNLPARGGGGDTPRTLDICRRLAGDHDDMVAKALSWALRELSKRDDAAVRAFLKEHEGRLASRVLREVRRKLATGRK